MKHQYIRCNLAHDNSDFIIILLDYRQALFSHLMIQDILPHMIAVIYCHEPPPKGLRGYGGQRTDKKEGSVLWSSHYARSLQPVRKVRTGFCTAIGFLHDRTVREVRTLEHMWQR